MLRLKPTIQIFLVSLIALAIYPALTFAQPEQPIECDTTPPSLENLDFPDCSILLMNDQESESAHYTVEFTALEGGCVPTLIESTFDESSREIQLVLRDLTPEELGCTADIKIYSVASDPFPLSNGEWDVTVSVYRKDSSVTEHTRTVLVQPEVIVEPNTIYLPIVAN